MIDPPRKLKRIEISIAAWVFVAISSGSAVHARELGPREPVAKTELFTFHSDFWFNVRDALMEAAEARIRERPEPFSRGEASECFWRLSREERTAFWFALREPIEKAWTPYIAGDTDLPTATAALVRALPVKAY